MNKNTFQIGDLVELKHSSNVGLGVVLDILNIENSTIIHHSKIQWINIDHEDWYNNEFLKKVE